MNRETAIKIIDGVVQSDYVGTHGFVGSGEALNEVSEWLKSSEVSITTTSSNELVPFVQVEMTEEEIGQVVDQVIEVQVLKGRINELEAALSHLYECHSYGGEISEDEHKKASREALRSLMNKVAVFGPEHGLGPTHVVNLNDGRIMRDEQLSPLSRRNKWGEAMLRYQEKRNGWWLFIPEFLRGKMAPHPNDIPEDQL